MKFFGIVMVFAIHSNRSGNYNYFFQAITLQLFFFCSGMFCRKGLSLKFFDFVWQGLRKIMVPYFIFAVSSGVLQICFVENAPGFAGMLIRSMLGIRNHLHVGTLWFLPALFCMSVFFYIARAAGEKFGRDEKQRNLIFYLAIAIIYAAGIACQCVLRQIVINGANDWHLPWNVDLGALFLPWYFFGYLFFPWFSKFEYTASSRRGKFWFGIAGVVALAVTAWSLIFPQYYETAYLALKQLDTVSFCITYWLLLPVPVFAGMLIIMKHLNRLTFLAKVGQCTLYFCCLEAIFVLIITLVHRFTGLVVPGCPIGEAPANGMPTGVFFACFEVLFMYFLLVPPAKKIFKKIM